MSTEAPATAVASAVMDALREVVDPEIGLDVVDLGLVYEVHIDGPSARVRMTMTTPACPFSWTLVRDAEKAIRRRVPELTHVEVALAWDPPWTSDRLSPHAKQVLGWGR